MITPLTERQKTLIVNNLVAACKDINKLNRTGYGFIYQASGFIAHYDLGGFIAAYSDGYLTKAILDNERFNMWNNFHEGDDNYEYYMSKKDVYQRLVAKLK